METALEFCSLALRRVCITLELSPLPDHITFVVLRLVQTSTRLFETGTDGGHNFGVSRDIRPNLLPFCVPTSVAPIQLRQLLHHFTQPSLRPVPVPSDLPETTFRVTSSLLRHREITLPLDEPLPDSPQSLRGLIPRSLRLNLFQAQRLDIRFGGPELGHHALAGLPVSIQDLVQLRQAIPQPFHVVTHDGYFNGQVPLSKRLVPFSPAFLPGQRPNLGLDFADHILQPRQVPLGMLEAPHRRLTTVLVLADPRGLLEELAALLRPIRQNRVDHSIFDDRVGVGAEPGTAADVQYIAKPTRRAIQRIIAPSVSVDGASDLDLLERHWQPAVLIGNHHGDRTTVDRPAIQRSLEDGFLHLSTSDGGGTLLP